MAQSLKTIGLQATSFLSWIFEGCRGSCSLFFHPSSPVVLNLVLTVMHAKGDAIMPGTLPVLGINT